MIESLLIAAALLATALEEEGETDLWNKAAVAARERWIQAGVMEPREREWFFRGGWDWEVSEEAMESRLAQMQVDCPPADYPLPDRDFAFTRYTEAHKFVEYIRDRITWNLWPQWEVDLYLILADAEWRLSVWNEITDAYSTWGSRKGKRLALQRVRELIGREAFDSRSFPDSLPDAGRNSTWLPENENHLP